MWECIECVVIAVGEMLVLSRSLAPLRKPRCCRQLDLGRRGLRSATGGHARSAVSIVDQSDTATTTDGKPTYHYVRSTVHDQAREKIDTTFENAKEAYRSKTNFELVRGYSVFQMCSIGLFVNKNKQVDLHVWAT